jgi:hypothetical protein
VAIKTASAALSPTPPLKKARSARTTQHQPTPDRNIGERPLRARSGHSTTDKLSTHFLSATTCRLRMNGCFAPILLQKSIFRQSNAAKFRSANTKVRGRFSAKRYGPSRREAHQRL